MNFLISIFKQLFGIIGLADKEASKIHVTCVGVGYSKKYGNCSGASLDATNMYNLYRDITKDCKLFVDNNATKANLISSFVAGLNSDLNVLFYSGHGGSQSTSDSFEVDKKDEHLCLYDAPMLDNEIWNLVCQCKGRVLLIFDCCHSETMFRVPVVSLENISKLVGEPLAAGSSPKLMCWSGCPDNTYSYGGSDGGILTNEIIRRYRGNNKCKNYEDYFKMISKSSLVTKLETPKMTKLGSGWNVRVFH